MGMISRRTKGRGETTMRTMTTEGIQHHEGASEERSRHQKGSHWGGESAPRMKEEPGREIGAGDEGSAEEGGSTPVCACCWK
jgi:hypothetical protein